MWNWRSRLPSDESLGYCQTTLRVEFPAIAVPCYIGHMADASKPKLRWYQYSLRSLFLLTLLVAIGMSWVAVRMQRAREQRAAVEAIVKTGASVYFEHQLDASGNLIDGAETPGPAWLRRLLGDDFFRSVTQVFYAPGIPVTDNELTQLQAFSELQSLSLHGTQVTDAGLEHLKGLTQLKKLHLGETRITDAGLEHLKGLGKLQELDLRFTKITDAGMEHLKGLKKLTSLNIWHTEVTWAGEKDIRQALPKARVVRVGG
jgi:hypothetical protein